MGLLLMSCAGTGPEGNFCDIAEPIYIDCDDVISDATARQILSHNQNLVDQKCSGVKESDISCK